MKVLLAEYATACDPALAPEGAAMLGVLHASFSRCGYEVVQPGTGDFYHEIVRLAPVCDMGLVIAPDPLLAKFTLPVEQHSHNLGCGSMNAALCANKVTTGKILIKPRDSGACRCTLRETYDKTGERLRCTGRAAHLGCAREG